MDSSEIVGHVLRAILMMALLAGPILLGILALGLLLGVLQAATSINESTVAFVPKLLVFALVILLVGPITLSLFTDYIKELFARIPSLVN